VLRSSLDWAASAISGQARNAASSYRVTSSISEDPAIGAQQTSIKLIQQMAGMTDLPVSQPRDNEATERSGHVGLRDDPT
jgi:hypothetical protein